MDWPPGGCFKFAVIIMDVASFRQAVGAWLEMTSHSHVGSLGRFPALWETV